ncbi:MAG: hypothetical protein JXR94_00585 [Candidatus Hydrogenedentes bacterium]|nr:hypothetical protein [Candidatus Hydrogenedentota bacterium]
MRRSDLMMEWARAPRPGQASWLALWACCWMAALGSWCWADGPYPPGSFQALLAERAGTPPPADLTSVVQQIADSEAGAAVGVDAINYLGTDVEWNKALATWLADFARSHPETAAGARAVDLILSRTPVEDLARSAAAWAEEHRGTGIGLVAVDYKLQWFLDEADRPALRAALIDMVTHYGPTVLRSRVPRSPLIAALDALGEPEWAARLTAAREQPGDWEAGIRACAVAMGLRPEAESAAGASGVLQGLVNRLQGLFAADYDGDKAAFARECDRICGSVSTFALQEGAEAIGPGEVLPFTDDLVDGACRRAGRAHSFFLPAEDGQPAASDAVLVSCLDLLTQLASLRPEAAHAIAQSAKRYADGLADAALYAVAEDYYLFALDYGDSPVLLSAAGTALARLYETRWHAYASAEALLRDVIQRGAVPRTRVALARVLYRMDDFEGVVDVLTEYLELEEDQAQADRALFIIGQALNRLGRHEEKRAIWEDLRTRTNDPALMKALDTALGSGGE